MNVPRVTVIIATYNWSTVLPYSIGSALDQTLADFELLVVGDGCTDDSQQVVEAIQDRRVRWIGMPGNTGHQSGPNNRGLAEARGEFIAYLGHDDLWLPHHLACAVEALDARNAAMAHSIVALFAPGAEIGSPVFPLPEAGSWAPPSGTVHRRSVTERIGGWRDYSGLMVPPETDLWRRAEAAGFTFVFVPRLTAIKFPASTRRNVYRTRPCDEQRLWLTRIRANTNFEPEQLVGMMVGDEAGLEMRLRKLARLLLRRIQRVIVWSVSPRSGTRAFFWPRRGAGIPAIRKYKGL